MSPTPERDDVFEDVTCPSKSAFPGEPTYNCWIASDRPHMLHDDGEHHRWFDAIPDLPIAAWQADFLEKLLEPGVTPPKFMLTGHENTDHALREQADFLARPFDDLRLSELIRQQDETIRELAANLEMPQHYWPAEYASLEDLTADLRRLDHTVADLRMRGDQNDGLVRQQREAIRKERAKRVKLEAWYGAFVPRFAYGTISPRHASSAEALVEREAPRLAQFEAIRAGFESAFYPAMRAAWRGVEPEHDMFVKRDDTWEHFAHQRDELAEIMKTAVEEGEKVAKKKKIEDLPKVEYVFRDGTNTLVPADPEAAKVDHVMTRHGGLEIFGIARVSKKPIPDGTTIRTHSTGDIRLESYTGRPYEGISLDWQGPAPRAEAMAKIIGSGEVRTTSSTGGEKGVKPARFDLIPVMPLTRLAEHYGAGAAKYDAHQWRKGYELSKSYAAAQRHLTAFWDGEDNDSETGTPHLAAVTFHAFAMMQILQDFPQHDDRYKKEA